MILILISSQFPWIILFIVHRVRSHGTYLSVWHISLKKMTFGSFHIVTITLYSFIWMNGIILCIWTIFFFNNCFNYFSSRSDEILELSLWNNLRDETLILLMTSQVSAHHDHGGQRAEQHMSCFPESRKDRAHAGWLFPLLSLLFHLSLHPVGWY